MFGPGGASQKGGQRIGSLIVANWLIHTLPHMRVAPDLVLAKSPVGQPAAPDDDPVWPELDPGPAPLQHDEAADDNDDCGRDRQLSGYRDSLVARMDSPQYHSIDEHNPPQRPLVQPSMARELTAESAETTGRG